MQIQKCKLTKSSRKTCRPWSPCGHLWRRNEENTLIFRVHGIRASALFATGHDSCLS